MSAYTRRLYVQYSSVSDNDDDVEICLETTTKRSAKTTVLTMTRAEALALITQLAAVLAEPPVTEEEDQ